jgi:hypothetical protein
MFSKNTKEKKQLTTDLDVLADQFSILYEDYQKLHEKESHSRVQHELLTIFINAMAKKNNTLKNRNKTLVSNNIALEISKTQIDSENDKLKELNTSLITNNKKLNSENRNLTVKNDSIRTNTLQLISENKTAFEKNACLFSASNHMYKVNDTIMENNDKLTDKTLLLTEENILLEEKQKKLESDINTLQYTKLREIAELSSVKYNNKLLKSELTNMKYELEEVKQNHSIVSEDINQQKQKLVIIEKEHADILNEIETAKNYFKDGLAELMNQDYDIIEKNEQLLFLNKEINRMCSGNKLINDLNEDQIGMSNEIISDLNQLETQENNMIRSVTKLESHIEVMRQVKMGYLTDIVMLKSGLNAATVNINKALSGQTIN